MRLYIPFGREWFPYFMRRLGERPANLGFVVRGSSQERQYPLRLSRAYPAGGLLWPLMGIAVHTSDRCAWDPITPMTCLRDKYGGGPLRPLVTPNR